VTRGTVGALGASCVLVNRAGPSAPILWTALIAASRHGVVLALTALARTAHPTLSVRQPAVFLHAGNAEPTGCPGPLGSSRGSRMPAKGAPFLSANSWIPAASRIDWPRPGAAKRCGIPARHQWRSQGICCMPEGGVKVVDPCIIPAGGMN
jgi:hypothetical protein